MALDAYVMPLWGFKSGDFSSPIENALGVKPTILTPEPQQPKVPWHLRMLEKLGFIEFVPPPPQPSPEEIRARAIEEVETLKHDISTAVGRRIEWTDEGEVHYNKQFHDPSVLKAFAAWHDHQSEMPEFQAPPKLEYWKHPVRQLPKPEKPRFPILASHSLNTGYFLPVDFGGVHYVEPFRSWGDREFFHDVASTQAVLSEIDDLLLFLATVPEKKEPEHGSSPVGDVRWYAEELHRICVLSRDYRLPVIFWG